MRKVLSVAGLLLLVALFFVGMVLGGGEEIKGGREEPASLDPIGTLTDTDFSALEQAFGCPVPYGSRSGVGRVTDAQLGSLQARVLTWQADNGIVTRAVRPAEAIQLIRYDDLTLDNSTAWTLGSRTLLTAAGGNAACVYFSDEDAAYCLYQQNADIEKLLARLASDVTFPQ